jgi:hypothetical protein
LNVSHHATVDLGVSDSGPTIINIFGTDTVNFTGIDQAAVIVSLAPKATWIGTFDGAGKYSDSNRHDILLAFRLRKRLAA